MLILTGPTASGKSALALELCQQLDGELVSADSMQIYRGCDIATAKPTRDEQKWVRHHLIDILEPNQRFSAAQWAADARKAIGEIEARDKTPIICGGTGFYLRALLEPQSLATAPPDDEFRRVWEAKLAQNGVNWLHEQLQKQDENAAARIHPNDSYRVIRALEIAFSPSKTQSDAPPLESPIFGLEWPRAALCQRIETRVEAMLAAGFIEELKILVAKWGRDAPALGGVGYHQMLPVLDAPEQFDECVERWKIATRQYAKRQMTWFRHQLSVQWLDGSLPISQLADIVARQFR